MALLMQCQKSWRSEMELDWYIEPEENSTVFTWTSYGLREDGTVGRNVDTNKVIELLESPDDVPVMFKAGFRRKEK